MSSYDVKLCYDCGKDTVKIILRCDYKEVNSQVFVNQKPDIVDVWRAINNLKMDEQYGFIDKMYEKFKNGTEIMDLLVAYSEKCIHSISDEVRRLCEDALVYGMQYNGIKLLADKQENFKYFIAEAMWHIIELESDTWYTPPKHTKGAGAPLFPGMDALNAFFAASAVNYDEKAEEMYSRNPKLRVMIQDRYYW